jgi:predicted RNA binding protein YcfA (HicA-like mRNA interferase family)
VTSARLRRQALFEEVIGEAKTLGYHIRKARRGSHLVLRHPFRKRVFAVKVRRHAPFRLVREIERMKRDLEFLRVLFERYEP